jgi:uncharacterized protein
MSRTGFAHLPLHGGKAPRWLFERMVPRSPEIVIFLAGEFGREEVLRRLSDPYWFQAFGCVLGFDWHSSGLTTTVCGALKEGLRGTENELGIFAAGGKGATSRKTPSEISATCESIGRDPEPLVYASRISAKVDNSAVQDGYQLYHHSFVFTATGQWCIVQQGMSGATCHRDPARYSFAHGGKDGTPYPVDRATYDKTIEVMRHALNGAKIDRSEKVRAFRRLAEFSG